MDASGTGRMAPNAQRYACHTARSYTLSDIARCLETRHVQCTEAGLQVRHSGARTIPCASTSPVPSPRASRSCSVMSTGKLLRPAQMMYVHHHGRSQPDTVRSGTVPRPGLSVKQALDHVQQYQLPGRHMSWERSEGTPGGGVGSSGCETTGGPSMGACGGLPG